MTPLQWAILALLVAIPLVAAELYAATQPQYRKGCNECDAHRRRAEEAQRDLSHDYHHRTIGDCADASCPRNIGSRD